MKPAIVLGTHIAGLAVIRALGTQGVPVIAVQHDDNDMGFASKYVKEAIRAPHPVLSESAFVETLLNRASDWGNGILFPSTDAAVAAVARNKEQLDRHFVVTTPQWDTAQRFIEKTRTYELAEQLGVPAPKTYLPRSLEDAQQIGRNLEYPVVMKPSQSHLFYRLFSRKAVLVHGLDELVAIYRQVADAGLEVMVQEMIPGADSENANYCSYRWDDKCYVELTTQKVRTDPPEFGRCMVMVTKDVPELVDIGRRILGGIGFNGYSLVEFKRDARDGIFKLMDVNGRPNGSLHHVVAAGVNFPWIQYRHLILGETPQPMTPRDGYYWIDLGLDLVDSVRYHGKTRYSVRQYLEPYFRPHTFAVFSLKDPKPFLKRLRYGTRRISRVLRRKDADGGVGPGSRRDRELTRAPGEHHR